MVTEYFSETLVTTHESTRQHSPKQVPRVCFLQLAILNKQTYIYYFITRHMHANINNKKKNFLPLLQPNAGSEVKAMTWDRRYDNVPFGQSYRLPRGAVTGKWSNGGMMSGNGTEENTLPVPLCPP
jgi:hypothetical protein